MTQPTASHQEQQPNQKTKEDPTIMAMVWISVAFFAGWIGYTVLPEHYYGMVACFALGLCGWAMYRRASKDRV